jgi:hypothetical protein
MAPNTRYGCPGTFEYFANGRTIKELAKHLKRSERTIKDWMEGKTKIPFWVPELLRLQHMEYEKMMYQMRVTPIRLSHAELAGQPLYDCRDKPQSKPLSVPENRATQETTYQQNDALLTD